VSVSPFFMGEVEVTWDQYWAFYGETMSEGRTPPSVIYANNSREDIDAVSGPTPPFGFPDQGWGMGSRPAITMTHYAAETFCQWLSLKTGKKYRLPTEAEWEYACRAGDVQDIYGADVCAVNAWGLCNMGLYLEWCGDWYGEYGCAPVTDPAGPDSGELRVLRGGAFNQEQPFYRYAARTPCAPECEDWYAGRHSFRLCCSM
jgi:formylglycine-generating enzyme required for sulfatase activity